MARKRIEDITAELQSWLPNYDRGDDEYPTLLLRVLASLPGGDRLEDLGYETFNLGWHEADQLARVLDAPGTSVTSRTWSTACSRTTKTTEPANRYSDRAFDNRSPFGAVGDCVISSVRERAGSPPHLVASMCQAL